MTTTKTYVVTSAQTDTPINKRFLDSLENYCIENKAELLIVPIIGKPSDEGHFDERVSLQEIVSTHKKLNDNIRVENYNIKPQQIDPTTGLARFTQLDSTTLFASPKQRMKLVPNSVVKIPRILMSTGVISKPNYADNRLGYIAAKDHVYGAVIVDVINSTDYHFRGVRANKDSTFVDLGKRYSPLDVAPAALEALVLGDIHLGDTDPGVMKANINMIGEYRPKRVFLHDLFNGHSVNHHLWDKSISRASLYEGGLWSLEEELRMSHEFLSEMAQIVPEVIVVASNHHEFLNKYLESGRYAEDAGNLKTAAKLIPGFINGEDPYKLGVQLFGKLPKNVKFLSRDEDYKVLDWQLGVHGDKGANGARSNIQEKERSYGKSITAHTHTPEILRNTYIVGTSTYTQVDYNVGPSSWMNTNGLLWNDANVQLVNVINGKYRK